MINLLVRIKYYKIILFAGLRGARCQLWTVLICVVNDIEFLAKILLVDSILLYEVCNDTVREQKTQRRRKNSTTYAVLPGGVCERER